MDNGITLWLLLMLMPGQSGVQYTALSFEDRDNCATFGNQWQQTIKIAQPELMAQFYCVPYASPLPEPGSTKSNFTSV